MARKTFKKKIVTDELLEKVNPKNRDLLEMFLKEKSTRTSEMTILNYRSCGNIFFVWNLLHNENKLFTDLRKLDLSRFFSFTTDELKFGSSRNNGMRSFLSSLSSFIEKFLDDEYPNFKNIVIKTIDAVPKETRREKTVLTEEQVNNLLNHLKEVDSQKACWLALAAYSGSRFSELLRFTTSLIDENHTAFDNLFLETTSRIKTKGRGREGKLLYKYILRDAFLPYYKKWIDDRKKILEDKKASHDFLFIRENGEPATDGTVRSWVSYMEKFLGINLYPHALRHFLVTEFSRKNIPPLLIKDLVGWSSINMVEIYNDLESKDRQWEELKNLKKQ